MSILVSESEAMQTLPALLGNVSKQSVIITAGNTDLGVIVSMKDYEIIRKAKADRVLAAMDSLGQEIRENAAKAGISMEEVARMLDVHAE